MNISNLYLSGPTLILGIWLAGVSPGLSAGTAKPAQATNDNVTFCGTVISLVEAGCIGVKSSMVGPPTYVITSAKPKPNVGELISGSGLISHDPNFCMQGPYLVNIKWKKTDVCPMGDKGK